MLDCSAKQLAALGNETRRALLQKIKVRRSAVKELTQGLGISRPAVSQHLKILKEAGLVSETKMGNESLYRANNDALNEVASALQQFANSPDGGEATAPRSEADDVIDLAVKGWASMGLERPPKTIAMLVRFLLLSDSMEQRYEHTANEHGVMKGEVEIMSALRSDFISQGLTPGQLASGMIVSPANLSHRLSRLQSVGLVERYENPNDLRSVFIRLTPKGEAVIDAIANKSFREDFAPFLELSDEQVTAIDTILRKMLPRFR